MSITPNIGHLRIKFCNYISLCAIESTMTWKNFLNNTVVPVNPEGLVSKTKL